MGDLRFTEDAVVAMAALGPTLRRDRPGNNVALMLLARQQARPEPVARFWWAADPTASSEIGGFAIQVGDNRTVHVDDMDPELASRFAVEIAEACPDVPGVDGPVSAAASFAATWAAERHVPVSLGMFQRLYQLDRLSPPSPSPSPSQVAPRMRVAIAEDSDLVMPWAIAFQREALEADADSDEPTTVDVVGLGEVMRWKLDNGEIWLLEENGVVLCMVGATLLVEGVSRIHLVYTPPERRMRGLAAQATAGAVEAMLDAGATHCVLFADLANPTSNAVYRRLGFEPVREYLQIHFGRAPEG